MIMVLVMFPLPLHLLNYTKKVPFFGGEMPVLKKTLPAFLLIASAFISCSDSAISETEGEASSEQMDASSTLQSSSLQSSAKSSSSSALSSGTLSSSILSSSVSAIYWNQAISYGVLSDSRDKKKYRTTQIGSQNWMAENLNFLATVGDSRCYEANTANCAKYGRLYSWEAASVACPEGWHLPDTTEWNQLAKHLGGTVVAGKVLKAASALWSPNSGNDAFGFAALPSGRFENEQYFDLGAAGLWWTSSTLNSTTAFYRDIVGSGNALRTGSENKAIHLAARCIQDAEIPVSSSLVGSSSTPSSMIASSAEAPSSSNLVVSSSAVVLIPPDRNCIYVPNMATSPTTGTLTCPDNEVYKTVKIGSAIWMAQNLNYGTRVNGTASTGNQSNDGVIEKYCYDDNPANCDTDGGLYQWAEAMGFKFACNSVLLTNVTCNDSIAATNHQGICPTGWHIPKDSDWDALVSALGGDTSIVGSKMKLNNTTFTSWNSLTNVSNNDGNSSGFLAIPAGLRFAVGSFGYRSSGAYFWTATEPSLSGMFIRFLDSANPELRKESFSGKHGFSVRCVKDP